jgi:hypothetical protein
VTTVEYYVFLAIQRATNSGRDWYEQQRNKDYNSGGSDYDDNDYDDYDDDY